MKCIALVFTIPALIAPVLSAAAQEPSAPPHLIVGSPDSPDIKLVPIHARPALSQRLEPVADRLEHAPENIALLGNECPPEWIPRTTVDGRTLYVPLGLLVDESGEPQTSFTLLIACRKR